MLHLFFFFSIEIQVVWGSWTGHGLRNSSIKQKRLSEKEKLLHLTLPGKSIQL